MSGKIYSIYFSPTHNTEKVIKVITNKIKSKLIKDEEYINLTFQESREEQRILDEDDILVYGFPVYAGRMPILLEEELNNLQGNDTLAVIIATYGNREYDDSLLEAYNILSERGFKVIAVGAFVGEHSYTKKVASGRPDNKDLEETMTFGEKISNKILEGKIGDIHIKGNIPYKERKPMLFKPKTKDTCTNCGLCIEVCPMEVINKDNPNKVENGCILCCACIRTCPSNAKYIDADPINNIIDMLERKCLKRKDIEFFI